MELGELVGVLLDPPASGRAVVRYETPDEVSTAQVAWVVERALTPGRWSWTGAGKTQLFDGGTFRSYRGARLIEQWQGQPDYWHPELHLFAPIKGFFWGRRQDDWWMREGVVIDDAKATIRLASTRGDGQASLVVDLTSRTAVEFGRPSGTLAVVEAVVGPPDLSFAEPGLACTDEEFLAQVRPRSQKQGTVRWAG